MIYPDWPAPLNVMAFSSSRLGGVSQGAYAGLNTAQHVGDDSATVERNRAQLPNHERLQWLEQVHGDQVVELTPLSEKSPVADACFTRDRQVGCVIMTADCLPILLTNDEGSVVAAIHGGWRSLAAGIIDKTIAAMGLPGRQLVAWLGPAIGPRQFEVGVDVYAAFPDIEHAFRAKGEDKYLADLYTIAKYQLGAAGVTRCYGGQWCTFSDPSQFYSYRRDGQTGRMATGIWLA